MKKYSKTDPTAGFLRLVLEYEGNVKIDFYS